MKNYDILIPCAIKDVETLSVCIDSCRKHIKHNISNIYVVSNIKNKEIKDICQQKNCIFIDEDAVLGVSLSYLQKTREYERWGWIFQQLLKLSGNITKEENFIVVDSEVVFLKDISFESENRPIFYWHSMYQHIPYFEFIGKMFNFFNLRNGNEVKSFICDFMVFDKTHLNILRKKIEDKTGKDWIKGLLENLDFDEPAPFSEYEMYGFTFEDDFILRNIKHTICKELYTDVEELEKIYKDYDVVVMHKWLRE